MSSSGSFRGVFPFGSRHEIEGVGIPPAEQVRVMLSSRIPVTGFSSNVMFGSTRRTREKEEKVNKEKGSQIKTT